jgi:hypothetical protein
MTKTPTLPFDPVYEEDFSSLGSLLATHHASNTSAGRVHGYIVESTSDPSEAVLHALAVIQNRSNPEGRTETLTSLKARVDRLVDLSTDAAVRELAGHCAVLEALFLSLTIDAQSARNFDARSRLQKLAFQAQSAHARTLALVATLKAQQKGHGGARVVVHDDDHDRNSDHDGDADRD